VLDLIKSVFFLMFVAHLTACAWHFLGETLVQYGQRSWLIEYQTYGKPWQIRYIQSIYFSIITTLTIGYGDLVPKTDSERVFVILIALVICGVFGYTISSIGEIFKNIQEKRQKFKTQMKYINQYLKSKHLNKQL
jgi:Ion channel